MVGVQVSEDDVLDVGRILSCLLQGREEFVGAAWQTGIDQRQAVVLNDKALTASKPI